MLPNRLLGLVGQHENFPVENMSRSHCGNYVASCSHDQTVSYISFGYGGLFKVFKVMYLKAVVLQLYVTFKIPYA